MHNKTRNLLLTLTTTLALASPAAAASFDDDAYWGFADRMQQRLESTWDGKREIYRPGGGGVDLSVNAEMLLTHSVAALEGHEGASRQDERARAIALRLVSTPAYRTTPIRRSRHGHAPGWGNTLNGGSDQHLVFDAEVMEALAYAYRARRALDLPEKTVELIQDRVHRVAAGSYWRWPAIRLNQMNWYVLVFAADATVNGNDRALARGTRAHLNRFLGGARSNFGPGLRFHYLPQENVNHPMNVDSAEYANIVLSFSRYYEQARHAGMPAPSAARMRLLRSWVTRSISGYWTHAGYLNWDSGLGFDRWHQIKKLGLVQQALIGVASTEALQPSRAFGGYAKSMLDSGFELYDRWADRSSSGLAAGVAFGLTAVPQGRGSARLGASRMQANAVRAIDAGLGHKAAAEPPALYSFDPDIGRLAVTTPKYNTAIVAVNQRAFPYGGVEIARLFDAKQDVAGGIGGTPPASFGVWVRDVSGRRLLGSQIGRAAVSRGSTPLRLTKAPRGTTARASSSVGAAFAGSFTELRAVGTTSGGGVHVTTSHRFTPTVIDTRWTITGNGRRVTTDVLFPSTGGNARIVAVLRDGRRVTVGETRISLKRVARFEISSARASYTVTPLSRPRGATAHTVRPHRQSSAPNPGPTLGVQVSRAGKVGKVAFAARIRVL
jgi:hypothetical protein